MGVPLPLVQSPTLRRPGAARAGDQAGGGARRGTPPPAGPAQGYAGSEPPPAFVRCWLPGGRHRFQPVPAGSSRLREPAVGAARHCAGAPQEEARGEGRGSGPASWAAPPPARHAVALPSRVVRSQPGPAFSPLVSAIPDLISIKRLVFGQEAPRGEDGV